MASGSKYQIDMTRGPLFSKIVRFTLPLMMTNILQLLFHAADLIVIGQFAPGEALAAVGATSGLTVLVLNIFFGLGAGTRGGWYQATFFYESVCTFLGFLVCVLILTRNKHYKLGWCTAFYGIFYGTARLIIEGMRSDSLYLYIGTQVTDIKISQLVSIFSILLGVWTLSKIYRKQLLTAYGNMFKSERDQIAKSRIVLAVISAICLALAITMFALGGESKFIVGFVSAVVCIYTLIGVFAMNDRLKLYCKKCNKRKNITVWQSDYSASFTKTIVFGVAMGVLVIFGLFSLIKWGIVDGIPNGIVLAVVAIGVAIAMGVLAFAPACKKMLTSKKEVYQIQTTCACGETEVIELNSFLLFL